MALAEHARDLRHRGVDQGLVGGAGIDGRHRPFARQRSLREKARLRRGQRHIDGVVVVAKSADFVNHADHLEPHTVDADRLPDRILAIGKEVSVYPPTQHSHSGLVVEVRLGQKASQGHVQAADVCVVAVGAADRRIGGLLSIGGP